MLCEKRVVLTDVAQIKLELLITVDFCYIIFLVKILFGVCVNIGCKRTFIEFNAKCKRIAYSVYDLL